MCGRFTLRTKAKEIAEHFVLADVPDLNPRYNIAPSQKVAVIRFDPQQGTRQLSLLHWGLIPSWADNPAIGNRLINARSETVSIKPAFRQAFQKGRCLVVADGFFEWKKIGFTKQPYYIRLNDDKPFAFAGLSEHWQRGDQIIDSCTIITTEANELMADVHDRMPVILSPGDYDLWLEPDFHGQGKLLEMLRPYPADEMEAQPVSTLVNNPRNDTKECVEAIRS
jgi:putative SOS response-associated peptidase YedK